VSERPEVTLAFAAWQPQEDWLRHAARSALEQTGCRTEVLIVDDGSEPTVESMLGEPSITYIRTPHSGLPAARNAALSAMRGDYIRFLDHDDAFPPDSTARLLALAGGRQDVIAYGTTMVCDAELRPLWKMAARQQGDAVVPSLLARFNVRPGGVLWPRRVFELAGTFDTGLPMSEDWDMLQRALEHAEVRGDRAVVHYYRRHGAAMTRDHDTGMAVAAEIVERYFARHPEQRGTRLDRRAHAMLDAVAARVYATRAQPLPAARHALRALRQDPLAFGNELEQAVSALRGRVGRFVRSGR
jgi:glycosyltransferase involved in cell wall biosynthesis